jgi:NADH-quinone oxidoreductase subunit M
MIRLPVDWLEMATLVPLLGALAASLVRDRRAGQAWCGIVMSVTLVCTLMAAAEFYAGPPPEPSLRLAPLTVAFGRSVLAIDALSAPLVPVIALLHLLVALGTGRTKLSRFSAELLLAGAGLRLAMFSCMEPWPVIGLLAVGTVPPYLDLRNRGKPTGIYLIHSLLFLVLLAAGWAGAEVGASWAAVPLLLAVLVRSGTVPFHIWVPDLFENASFGMSLLALAPLTGVYAAVRLVLPVAPDWVLQSIGIASLITAVYASGLAVVQTEGRRFFAYLFLSHASLVLVGLELHTPVSLTGALCLWTSVMIALGGFGLTLRALEARFGRLGLTEFRGLYETCPLLAVSCLLTGLASVGFPGTLGFIGAELLVDGAVHANVFVGVGVVVASALNGIAVVRAYLILFTGARRAATVPMVVVRWEKLVLLTVAILILVGGVYPQPHVNSRHRAAEDILQSRPERGEGTLSEHEHG